MHLPQGSMRKFTPYPMFPIILSILLETTQSPASSNLGSSPLAIAAAKEAHSSPKHLQQASNLQRSRSKFFNLSSIISCAFFFVSFMRNVFEYVWVGTWLKVVLVAICALARQLFDELARRQVSCWLSRPPLLPYPGPPVRGHLSFSFIFPLSFFPPLLAPLGLEKLLSPLLVLIVYYY